MIKIYGMPTCPYCEFVHKQIIGREDEFQFIDIWKERLLILLSEPVTSRDGNEWEWSLYKRPLCSYTDTSLISYKSQIRCRPLSDPIREAVWYSDIRKGIQDSDRSPGLPVARRDHSPGLPVAREGGTTCLQDMTE